MLSFAFQAYYAGSGSSEGVMDFSGGFGSIGGPGFTVERYRMAIYKTSIYINASIFHENLSEVCNRQSSDQKY